MAKRFIDTSFYKSPFVRGLKGSLKGLYSFIICDCNGAGIWAADFQAASMYTGFEITQNEFEASFVTNGKAVYLENGKYFFPDFIEHQYPKGLSAHNPAQKNFISELQKYSLIDADLKVLKRPFEGSKVMVKVMEEVLVKEKVTVKAEKKIDLVLPFESEKFKNAWNLLLREKKWKNKSPVALQASLKKLAANSEEDAIQMIENTMAGEWSGIFELEKNKNGNSKKNGNTTDRQAAVSSLAHQTRNLLAGIENANNAGSNTS